MAYYQKKTYQPQVQNPEKYLSKAWFQALPVITSKPIEVIIGRPEDPKAIEKGIKTLKRKMNDEGVLQELRDRRYWIPKPLKRRLKSVKAKMTAHMSING